MDVEKLVGVSWPPWVAILALFGLFTPWILVYCLVVYRGFKDKAYGIPVLCICLDITWELIFSFDLVAPQPLLLELGHLLWFVIDCVILTQLLRYGPALQSNPWLRKNFYAVVFATLVLCGLGIYTFSFYFNDVYGNASAWFLALVLAALFPALFFSRPDSRGLSYGVAWWMMIGNAGAAVFCYYWWPAQFADGRLIRPPSVPEPPSYAFMNLLYVAVPLLNAVYLVLYRQRLKRLETAPPAATA